jgi:hypothetical protein
LCFRARKTAVDKTLYHKYCRGTIRLHPTSPGRVRAVSAQEGERRVGAATVENARELDGVIDRYFAEFYDRMIHECYRGGLKSARIVQEGMNEATILGLVSSGLGVGWVLGTARWRCPETVVVLPVVDLTMPLTLGLVWRRDNTSPLLANFIDDVYQTCEPSINEG